MNANIDLPWWLWPCAIAAPVLLFIVRLKCIDLAEGYAKVTFRLASMGLPSEAKEAWRQESLHDIIEFIAADRWRGLSREAAAWHAVTSTTDLLVHGWSERRHYQVRYPEPAGSHLNTVRRLLEAASWLVNAALWPMLGIACTPMSQGISSLLGFPWVAVQFGLTAFVFFVIHASATNLGTRAFTHVALIWQPNRIVVTIWVISVNTAAIAFREMGYPIPAFISAMMVLAAAPTLSRALLTVPFRATRAEHPKD